MASTHAGMLFIEKTNLEATLKQLSEEVMREYWWIKANWLCIGGSVEWKEWEIVERSQDKRLFRRIWKSFNWSK